MQYVPICPDCGSNHEYIRRRDNFDIEPVICTDSDNEKEIRLVCLGDMPPLVKVHYDKCIEWGDRYWGW